MTVQSLADTFWELCLSAFRRQNGNLGYRRTIGTRLVGRGVSVTKFNRGAGEVPCLQPVSQSCLKLVSCSEDILDFFLLKGQGKIMLAAAQGEQEPFPPPAKKLSVVRKVGMRAQGTGDGKQLFHL